MAEASRILGDHTWTGTHRFLGEVVVPEGSFDDDDLAADADVASTKLNHRFNAIYAQANTTAAAETRVIYVARAAGTVLSAKFGSIAAAVGDSTVTLDLKKNGTTVLTGTVVLDNANTARVVEAGTLVVTPTYVAGDVFEVVQTVSAGTGTLPTGVFGVAVFDEAAT